MDRIVATFSIVARDPATGDLGVAVQSRFLAVGAVVPWAAADAGAIATQSYANTRYGPEGLALLRQGLPAQAVLDRLVAADPDRDLRQVGVVDREGRAATFTGARCMAWAGGVTGPGFACQGNILAGPEVVQAMARAYQETQGDLAQRLVAALAAGQEAGGDARGQQSAALLVVREGGGYGGHNDRRIDLRVDDHPDPIGELARLLKLWRLYFEKPDQSQAVALAGHVRVQVTAALVRLGHLLSDTPTWAELQGALRRWIGTENFEERDLTDQGLIDREVLAHLLRQAGLG